MRQWFRVEARGGATGQRGGGEILVYHHIGRQWRDEEAVSAAEFVQTLRDMVAAGPGDITIRINSPGGDVADGMAIYNAIRDVKDRVVCRVEGAAYSMASVIAIAGRTTQMYDTSQFMLHNPSTLAWGTERELDVAKRALQTAKQVLVTAYTSKTKKSSAEIEELMERTTWLDAYGARDHGFVDEVLLGAGQIAACFDVAAWASYYRNPAASAAPWGTNVTNQGDPRVEWDRKVRARMDKGACLERATYDLVAAEPDLHRRYMAACGRA